MTETELNEYRKQLDEIDKTIAENFEKRMKIVYEIAKYKKSMRLPTYDPKREQAMFEKNLHFINDNSIKPFYKDLLQKCLDLSKLYQQQIRESPKSDIDKNKKII